jgi:hypothetical protein
MPLGGEHARRYVAARTSPSFSTHDSKAVSGFEPSLVPSMYHLSRPLWIAISHSMGGAA